MGILSSLTPRKGLLASHSLTPNRDGSTMVEMLVITGVGAAFALGLANAVTLLQRQGSRTQARGDWKTLLGLMNTTLSNSQQCTNFLKNIKFTGGKTIPVPSLGIVSKPLTSLVDTSNISTPALSVTNYSMEFLEVGKLMNGFCTTSMQLVSIPGTQALTPSPGVKQYQVYLSINAKQIQGIVSGVATPTPSPSPTGSTGSTDGSLVSSAPACTLANVANGLIKPDLFSGTVISSATATAPAVLSADTISLVVNTSNASGTEVITSCSAAADPVSNTCQNFDGNTSLVNGKCVVNSLNLNSGKTLPEAVLNASGTSPSLSFQYNGTEALNLGPQTVSVLAPAWMQYISINEGATTPNSTTPYASQSACCQAQAYPASFAQYGLGVAGFCDWTEYGGTRIYDFHFTCSQTGPLVPVPTTVLQASFPGYVTSTGNVTVTGNTSVGSLTTGTLSSGNIALTSGGSVNVTSGRAYQVIGGGLCLNSYSITYGSATCVHQLFGPGMTLICPSNSIQIITMAIDYSGIIAGTGGICVQ